MQIAAAMSITENVSEAVAGAEFVLEKSAIRSKKKTTAFWLLNLLSA